MNPVRALLGLALVACAEPPPTTTLQVVMHVPAPAVSTPVPDAVVIDIETGGGLDYRSVLVAEQGGTSRTETTLNGEPFSVESDALVIGGKRYGPLRPGTVVRVSAAGVLIDGVKAEPR